MIISAYHFEKPAMITRVSSVYGPEGAGHGQGERISVSARIPVCTTAPLRAARPQRTRTDHLSR
jgi:hypothetical protein